MEVRNEYKRIFKASFLFRQDDKFNVGTCRNLRYTIDKSDGDIFIYTK